MNDDETHANVRLTGTDPERVAFEAWKLKQGGHYMSRNNAPGSDLNGYQDAHTQGQWEAWQAAAQTAEVEPDVADIIAGALQTSRGHAYELMQAALDARDA